MIHLSEKNDRYYRTSVMYLAITSLGMCLAIPGPTLLELEKLVNTQVSKIYIFRSAGYVFGSLTGGILLDNTPHKLQVLLLTTAVMGIVTIIIPFSRALWFLCSAMAISGISMGALDTGLNVWCLNIWGDGAQAYFQGLHFFFGVGACIGPLIAGLFLSNTISDMFQTDFDDIHINETKTNLTNLNHTISLNNIKLEITPPVTYAYVIIGVICLVTVLLFLLLLFVKVTEQQSITRTSYKDPSIKCRLAILVISCLLLFVYCGTEIGYAQMIAVYAVKSKHKLSESNASYVASVFWASFTLFRFISTFAALKLNPLLLLLFDFCIMSFAGLMLVFLGNTYVSCLWVGSGLLGVGLSSFYASTVTWVEKYINVTNKIASFFAVAGSLGEMITPLTISQNIEVAPERLFYIILLCIFLCGLLIIVLWLITNYTGEKQRISFSDLPKMSENEMFLQDAAQGPIKTILCPEQAS